MKQWFALKTASNNVIHKAVEATGELKRNKIADKNVKPKPKSDENSRNVGEIVIPPEKKQTILNKLRQVL